MTKAKKENLHPQTMPRTIRDVTRFLAQSGVEGVSLERGRGFFYFVGVPVHNWLNRTVVTPTLATRTLGQWLDQYRRMEKQNASPNPFTPPTAKRRKARKPRQDVHDPPSARRPSRRRGTHGRRSE